MVYLKLMLTAAFWGGTFVAGRMLAADVPPHSAAFIRFLIASLLLILISLRQRGSFPLLKAREILPVLMLGLTGVYAYNVFFFKGLALIQAGRAALIIALNPVAIAILSAVFLKERLTALKIAGILLSFAGAAVVITRGDLFSALAQGVGWGEILVLGCVISWGSYSVIGKHVMKRLSPRTSVTYAAVLGMAALAFPAYSEGLTARIPSISINSWLALAYLAVFGTVFGFVWFYQGIQQIGPTRAGLFINFVPICAILLAWLILGEPVTASLLLGALLVAGGVYLINRKPRKRDGQA